MYRLATMYHDIRRCHMWDPLPLNIHSTVLACEPSLYSASEFSYSAGKRHPLWHGLPEAVSFAASLFLFYRLFTAFEMPTSLLHVYDILSGQLESTSHWLFPLDCPLFHGCSPRLWLYYGIVNAYRYRSPRINSGQYIYKQLDRRCCWDQLHIGWLQNIYRGLRQIYDMSTPMS